MKLSYRELVKLRNELQAEGFNPKDIVNIIVEENDIDRKDKELWKAMFAAYSPSNFFDDIELEVV